MEDCIRFLNDLTNMNDIAWKSCIYKALQGEVLELVLPNTWMIPEWHVEAVLAAHDEPSLHVYILVH